MKTAVLLTFLLMGAVTSVKISHVSNPVEPKIQFCTLCDSLAGQVINAALNIILQGGVIGGCADICGKISNKDLGTLCNIGCAVLGVKEFIALIEKADIDPIYYCEEIKLCPIKDDGDAKITSLTVMPAKVVYGSDFEIDMSFQTVNGTGTGEVALEILTVDDIPLGDSQLLLPQDPGSYNAKWTVTAEADPDCDPTQGPCEMWLPGNYTVTVALCNGECGSKHPHSQIYDVEKTIFTVVQN